MNSTLFRSTALYTLIALVLLGLSGCSSLIDAGTAISSGKERVSGAAERAVMDATGISAMQDAMVASLVYSYAFFAGGYMPGYDDFEEGEGVKWILTVTDEEGEDESATIERALLKRLPEGRQWWFLSYRSGEEEMVSEALLSEDYEIEVFRYRDPETGEINEWIPEESEAAEEAGAETPEAEGDEEAAEAPGFYSGNWQEHIVGRENVKVPAGSYLADHARVEMEYSSETGEDSAESGGETATVTYEWWISDDAPGKLVRYRWSESSEEGEYLGELVEHRKNYRSQLNSF